MAFFPKEKRKFSSFKDAPTEGSYLCRSQGFLVFRYYNVSPLLSSLYLTTKIDLGALRFFGCAFFVPTSKTELWNSQV